MRTFGLWIVALLCLSCCSLGAKVIEGNGKLETRSIPVATFDQIAVGISQHQGFSLFKKGNSEKQFVCQYAQQNDCTLQITTDANLFDYLETSIESGKLIIRTLTNTSIRATSIRIEATSKELTGVFMSGGFDFELTTPLQGKHLELGASGGADIHMKPAVNIESCQANISGGADISFDNLTCTRFEGNATGGSDLDLKGQADEATFNCSGGSDVEADDFCVKQVACNCSGGSDGYVYATEELNASASGGSDIYYKGNPQRFNKAATGGGSVKKR